MNPLMSKIALACYAAAACLFCIAAVTIAGIVLPGEAASRSNELLKDIRPNASPAAVQPALEDYVAVKPDRFMSFPPPQPAQPSAEQPQEQPPPSGVAAAYVLRGVMYHSTPALSRAFIEIPGVEEEHAYKIGDTVHGATISAIGERSIDILRSDRIYTLVVRFDDLGSAAPPEPQPQSAGVENREERRDRAQGETQGRRENREERQNRAQGDAQGRWDSWESVPQRIRERLQSLSPEERERFLRMSQSERAEFYRARFRQTRDQERNPQRR